MKIYDTTDEQVFEKTVKFFTLPSPSATRAGGGGPGGGGGGGGAPAGGGGGGAEGFAVFLKKVNR